MAMRPRDAAQALGISPRTLWSLTQRGEIPHVRVGACVLYPTAAVMRWLEELTAHPPVKRPEAAERGDA